MMREYGCSTTWGPSVIRFVPASVAWPAMTAREELERGGFGALAACTEARFMVLLLIDGRLESWGVAPDEDMVEVGG